VTLKIISLHALRYLACHFVSIIRIEWC